MSAWIDKVLASEAKNAGSANEATHQTSIAHWKAGLYPLQIGKVTVHNSLNGNFQNIIKFAECCMIGGGATCITLGALMDDHSNIKASSGHAGSSVYHTLWQVLRTDHPTSNEGPTH